MNSKKSLKFKLLTLSLGITLVLGASSLGILRFLISNEQKDTLNTFEVFSRNLGDAVAAQFYERYGDVQAFAINPDIRSSSRQTIIDALNTYSAMYGIYDLIMIVDGKGQLVAVNNKNPDGKDINVQELYKKTYAETPWFKATMSGQLTEDKDKSFSGTYIEEIQIDPYTSLVLGGNKLGSSFNAPIKDGKGKVIGVVSNRAGSRWFEVAFREQYANLRKSGFPNAKVSLLGKDGTLYFEYTSDPNSEKLADSKYNWESLLKLNLVEAKSQAASKAITRLSGATIEDNGIEKEKSIYGYSPINSQKFIDKIGWSCIVSDPYSEAFREIIQAQNLFYIVFALTVSGACAVAYLFSMSLSKTLSGLAKELSDGSSEVLTAATSISRSSTQLSESATEQAAAIQETAASIGEVSSMVKKSADNASQSQKASDSSRVAAEEGQQAVQEMMQSISDISQSNTAIMNQVEDGNRQISEIVKVISEIGNKTKVINDIVFQTKLLSFNASVEAARAGEHGKGFAVVAEEVGNLAQMSGNAAKEISEMLDSSINKVEGIVNETKSKVERLVTEGRTKVESGTQVATRCGEALSKILATVQEVDRMVSEISSASQEQAQGVSEINKAINQLDQVTQQNSTIAQDAARFAEQLNSQANLLKGMVENLFGVVTGEDQKSNKQTGESGHASTIPNALQKGDHNKVVAMKRVPKTAKDNHSPNPLPAKLKKAAGAETLSQGQLPSKDDPRFEDV